MLTFVKQKTNDRGNRSEDITVHHVQNTAHVINIGGARGIGGIIDIVGLISLRIHILFFLQSILFKLILQLS